MPAPDPGGGTSDAPAVPTCRRRSALVQEPDRGQRGAPAGSPRPGDRATGWVGRLDDTEVADARAAVLLGVGVEDLAPVARSLGRPIRYVSCGLPAKFVMQATFFFRLAALSPAVPAAQAR